MTQLVELPPADAGLGPHCHSGPVFGYVFEGRILFELEGEEPREIVAGEAFWEPDGDVVHYQVANLDSGNWSRLFAVCIWRSWRRHDHHARTAGDRGPRSSAPPQRPPTRRMTVTQAIIAGDRVAGVGSLSVAEVPYPHAAENDVIVRVHATGFTPGELDCPKPQTLTLSRSLLAKRSAAS
jgi:hypothetical protein